LENWWHRRIVDTPRLPALALLAGLSALLLAPLAVATNVGVT
jgi:hypothetical protein